METINYNLIKAIDKEKHNEFKKILKENVNIAVIGKIGAGKTTLLKYLTTLALEKSKRALIIERDSELIKDPDLFVNTQGCDLKYISSENSETPLFRVFKKEIDESTENRDLVVLGEITGREIVTIYDFFPNNKDSRLITTFAAKNYQDFEFAMCLLPHQFEQKPRAFSEQDAELFEYVILVKGENEIPKEIKIIKGGCVNEN